MADSQDGFTLVELMIATSVLAILVVIGLGALNPLGQFRKTRDSRRKSDLAQIKRALLMYHNDNGQYPATGSLPSAGSIFESANLIYMKTMPGDPSGGDYSYDQTAGGQDYCLRASLEQETDSDIANSQRRCATACAEIVLGGNDYVVCAD